jgi:cation diffusion facilitator family transporter
MADTTRRALYAAIAGNLAIAVTKLIAAAMTGSSSMLTEGIHSIVDSGNDGLMLVGIAASRRPPDEAHPFGHGQALYFYSLMVGVLIFGIGGGLAVYEGVREALNPKPLEDATISFIVLGLAAGFEGMSWYFGLKAFQREKGSASVWSAIRQTKDPTTFAVLLEDSAALLGIAFAAIAIGAAHYWHAPILDAFGSIMIGLLLCTVGAIMLRESKGLLLGEPASKRAVRELCRIVAADPDVDEVMRLLTLQLGPHSVMLAVDLRFRSGLSSNDVARSVDRIEKRVSESNPDVEHIFIEAEAMKTVRS